MFTKIRIFNNLNGESAVVFIHDIKYIISIGATTIISDRNCFNTLEKLGFIYEIK